MKTIRKTISAALVFAILASLASGCGAAGSSAADPAGKTGSVQAEEHHAMAESTGCPAADESGFTVSAEMIPYDTEMTGSHGGYFFIPMNGNIYRYGTSSTVGPNVTKSDLVFEFVENGAGVDYEHSVYQLQEYPGCDVLYDICREKNGKIMDEILIEYIPAAGVDEGELDQALDSGFVMMENGSVIHGKDLWLAFCEKTESGEPASVRIGKYYTLDKTNADEEYYEAVKADYPALYLNELAFDGTRYTISPMHRDGTEYIVYEQPGYDNPVTSWKYLMHYTGKPSSKTALFHTYDKYVLVNDDTVSWEDLERGLFSSQLGDFIPFCEVFCEYTWK